LNFASPMLATNAVAVSGPMPGTFSRRRHASLARCQGLDLRLDLLDLPLKQLQVLKESVDQ
jgi:hypothetical protein